MTIDGRSLEKVAPMLLTASRVAVPPRIRAALDQARRRTSSAAAPIASIPQCLSCGSDENLVYPEFHEQETLFVGTVRPAWASYCCTLCGASRRQAVPVTWRPPGWFGCT